MQYRILILLCLCFLSSTSAYASLIDTLTFKVWIDRWQVGMHVVTLSEEDTGLVAVTNVNMGFKVVFVKVFDYEHEARETWKNGCLQRLDSNTLVNREAFFVTAQLSTPDSTEFVIEATQPDRDIATKTVTECGGSFAYWDLEKLQRPKLINTQTGKTTEVQLEKQGTSRVPKTDRMANAYVLRNDAADIRLWYSNNNEWLGLQTITRGRELTYVREDLL